MIPIEELSTTQRKVLRLLAATPNQTGVLGGRGRAPLVSAARVLERKGVILRASRAGHLAVSGAYRDMAREELSRHAAERRARGA